MSAGSVTITSTGANVSIADRMRAIMGRCAFGHTRNRRLRSGYRFEKARVAPACGDGVVRQVSASERIPCRFQHLAGKIDGAFGIGMRGITEVVRVAPFDRPTCELGQIDRVESDVVGFRKAGRQAVEVVQLRRVDASRHQPAP